MRILLLIFSILFLSSCAMVKAKEEVQKLCGVKYFKEPSIEQMKCMEEKGKNIDGYVSIAWKIEREEKKAAENYEKNVKMNSIVKARYKPPIGGIISSPPEHNPEFVKEAIRRFCESQQMDKFQIVEHNFTKEFRGTSGGAWASCTAYGCSSSGGSTAKYSRFLETTFECESSISEK